MSLLHGFSNNQLLKELRDLVVCGHAYEAELVSYLGEVDSRKLYLGQACPSMFHYCVHELGFAEGVAYKRIAVARASRRFPELLHALQVGEIHLTGACLIAPHLENSTAHEWLNLARGATASEIKQRIADRKPKVAGTTSVRRVSGSRLERMRPMREAPTSLLSAGPRQASQLDSTSARGNVPTPEHTVLPSPRRTPNPQPLGCERYNVRFVAHHDTHEKLEELRALMRHSIPDGDIAKILARAVEVLLEKVRKQKIGTNRKPIPDDARRPRAGSKSGNPARKIPTAIRRAVWVRDGGKCTYQSRGGKQCGSREYLEFHHQIPWVRCRAHEASNIFLRCRAHNQYEAELVFGAVGARLGRPTNELAADAIAKQTELAI